MKNRSFKGIYLKLNTGSDNDIIKRLDEQNNKQGYIKRLIREDVAFEHFYQTAFDDKEETEDDNV